jgi:hypothetical protein
VARIAIDDVAAPTGVAVWHAAALGVIRAPAHRRALRAHDSATTRAKSVALTIPTGSRALQTTTRRARRSATCAATRYSFMSAGRQITAVSYAASVDVDRADHAGELAGLGHEHAWMSLSIITRAAWRSEVDEPTSTAPWVITSLARRCGSVIGSRERFARRPRSGGCAGLNRR